MNISITRITRVNNICFCYVAISNDISAHDMLTFRLMVTMVAEFCSLVILIHNTLLGEITISSARTTSVKENIIPLFLSCNDTFPHAKMQDHWFYGY